MDTVQPSSEIGRRLRQLRHSRGKSLTMVAGLAGISKSYLSLLERGERALDRRSVIAAVSYGRPKPRTTSRHDKA